MTARDRRAELRAKPAESLTPMERGALWAFGPEPTEPADASSEARAAALLARPTLTGIERGQLRALATRLPVNDRRRIEAYLDASPGRS